MKVDACKYAQTLIDNGCPVRTAEKFACIIARQGIPGEEIITYVSTGLIETVNTVKSDPETGSPDWVLTMANPDGTPAIYSNGHTNTYVVSDKTFRKKYKMDNEYFSETCVDKVLKPKGGPQNFVKINEDISFTASWGETQNIDAGGYLNVTNKDVVYGIAEKEFNETYRFTETEK